MSPASKSKSKSKDKSSGRAVKEQQQKISSKLSVSNNNNTGNGSPTSAYNPFSGTFHTLDAVPTVSSSPSNTQRSGRFQNIEDTDEQHSGSSHGASPEYDLLSNNGSSSGESEDHNKEKTASNNTASKHEFTSIPGSDNDKREKIRQKNERKHQRQRERRAYELHERCTSCLMSRKLEILSQQLVAMGFSTERATLALILNEGRVEESVSWLFESTSEEEDEDLTSGLDLKIDISEELNQITALEVKYKCSKQEVERAVVASEGDFDKAGEILRAAQNPPEEEEDKEEVTNLQQHHHIVSRPEKEIPTVALGTTLQQRGNERDHRVSTSTASILSESSSRNLQSNQPKSRPVARGVGGGLSSSVSSYSMPPSQLPMPTKEAQQSIIMSRNEGQYIQTPPPVSMMIQFPQSSLNMNQSMNNNNASPPVATTRWYANSGVGVDYMKANRLMYQHHQSMMGNYGQESVYPRNNGMIMGGGGAEQWNPHNHNHHHHHGYNTQNQHYGNVDPTMVRVGATGLRGGSAASSSSSSSPMLTIPSSSLGLYSGWGSSGTSYSHMDWSAGNLLMSNCDYNNIDWTLELQSSSSSPSKPRQSAWSSDHQLMMGMRIAANSRRSGFFNPNGGGDNMVGSEAAKSGGGGLHEWTSPFAGKDIFSLPRQFVTSPSP